MVILALPIGTTYGWGNCGRWVTREMARLTDVHLLIPPIFASQFANEVEHVFFQGLAGRVEALRGPQEQWPQRIDHPMLGGTGYQLKMTPAWGAKPRGKPNVGYTFFERDTLSSEIVENARRHFDCILTGSNYCTDVLRRYDVPTGTVIQGVDHETFHPSPQHRRLFADRFVIFSGGRFELRKGQDLVIRAVNVLQARHRDVLLVGAWHTSWGSPDGWMAGSKFVELPPASEQGGGNYREYVMQLLAVNKVDPSRVILPGPLAQHAMADVYHETDIGLFPNRCESGTNLVLMEYMACGKPAIASWTSGHRDILTDQNSVIIRASKPLPRVEGEGLPFTWDEPDLDEIIEKLEWAYQNRDALKPIASQAALDMGQYTWTRTAQEFLDRLNGSAPLSD